MYRSEYLKLSIPSKEPDSVRSVSDFINTIVYKVRHKKSWRELTEKYFDGSDLNEEEKKIKPTLIHYSAAECFDSEILFRGQSSSDYDITPSIARLYNEQGRKKNLLEYEKSIIDAACLKFPDILKPSLLPIERLAMMQHYGIHTRLLDVSENPLVALYFACCDNEKKDGEVIVFYNMRRKENPYPIMQSIADTYRLIESPSGFVLAKDFLNKAYRQTYFKNYEDEYRNLYKDEQKVVSVFSTPIFVNAPAWATRQTAQQGMYLLFPNQINLRNDLKDSFLWGEISPWSKNHPYSEIIRIPKESKPTLLRNLKMMGITRSRLFPENLDYACEELMDNVVSRKTSNEILNGR